jgi:S-adenosylmethionine:tRNA ribosyltransferase-isomerase
LLHNLAERGIILLHVTLHVGWGTFLPLPEGDLTQASLHPERYAVPRETALALAVAKRAGKRVIAVGTTAARALESAANSQGEVLAGEGETRLFIQPGYAWKTVGGLLTNFHLPASSLLMLVCAFGGTPRVLAAYHEAVQQKYHFYSYGDAMLLL